MVKDYAKFLTDLSIKKNETIALSPVDAKRDIELLVEALNSAYPGQWVMGPHRWKEIIKELEAIRFNKEVSITLFGNIIADILWKVPDGHLRVSRNSEILGREYQKNYRPATTGRNIANPSQHEVWKIEKMKSSAGFVPVLGISSFPQASEPQWTGFAESVKSHLNAEGLIIDLRANKGGDDTKGIELASILLGHDLTLDWIQETSCETAEAYALQVNTYARIIWQNYLSQGQQPPPELNSRITALENRAAQLADNPLGNPQVRREMSKVETRNNSKLKFEKNVFVLIDSQTMSSGEWTALYLKVHPKVKLVGESTYGMIHFGNSGLLQLPNSNLNVNLCMKINQLTDGRFFEKSGIPADIKVANEDSLDFTLQELMK